MVDNENGNQLNPPVSFHIRIVWRHISCYAFAGGYNTEQETSLYSYQGVFTNDLGVNLDDLLGLPNQSAKRNVWKWHFWLLNNSASWAAT